MKEKTPGELFAEAITEKMEGDDPQKADKMLEEAMKAFAIGLSRSGSHVSCGDIKALNGKLLED